MTYVYVFIFCVLAVLMVYLLSRAAKFVIDKVEPWKYVPNDISVRKCKKCETVQNYNHDIHVWENEAPTPTACVSHTPSKNDA